MSNPIDLGKLQEEVKNARMNLAKAITKSNAAKHTADIAVMRSDLAYGNVKKAQEVLDKAQRAVVEGARTIAQG